MRNFVVIFENSYEVILVKDLDLEQVAEYLSDATILETMDGGFALAHYGETGSGHKFFLVNDAEGNSSIVEF